MPRYFFHFTNGRQKFTDSAGVELPGIGATRQHAAQKIRELRDVMPGVKLQNWLDWKIIAVDSIGNTVHEIGFDFAPLDDPEVRRREEP
jgi:Domain of unknown function (DUF6894)